MLEEFSVPRLPRPTVVRRLGRRHTIFAFLGLVYTIRAEPEFWERLCPQAGVAFERNGSEGFVLLLVRDLRVDAGHMIFIQSQVTKRD